MKPVILVLSLILLSGAGICKETYRKTRSLYKDGSYSSLSSLIKLSKNVANAEASFFLPKSSSGIRVVGGTEAKPHQFPFQVSLQVRNYQGGYDHNCGGVIYDRSHILTATHCVRGYHAKNLRVVAGEHELFRDDGAEQYRDVLGYLFHPGFDQFTLENDIAIITLDHPLNLNDGVAPINVPNKIMDNQGKARTSGWGSDGTEMQMKLLYVDLHLYSRQNCEDSWPGKIMNGMLCAGGQNGEGGIGSCNGDSGGPLICKDNNDKDYLCGLVSWGSTQCAIPNYPTVFTDINNYVDWIHGLLPPQELTAFE